MFTQKKNQSNRQIENKIKKFHKKYETYLNRSVMKFGHIYESRRWSSHSEKSSKAPENSEVKSCLQNSCKTSSSRGVRDFLCIVNEAVQGREEEEEEEGGEEEEEIGRAHV